MTFTALAFYYVGAMQGWLPNTSNVQSITLTAIVIPVLTSIVLPRYQAGHQQAPVSLAVNVAFCINIAILIYLWAN
ncbi:MAG: hypothetical protein R3183_12220 [Oleiphilaceae bacterium]|nr:hypothetical protein [Oleiphilaceae bacterium]